MVRPIPAIVKARKEGGSDSVVITIPRVTAELLQIKDGDTLEITIMKHTTPYENRKKYA